MSEEYISIESPPTIRDLEDEAYEDAGRSSGSSKSFGIKLQAILSGALLDKNAFSSKTPEERELIQSEIEGLENRIKESEHRIEELNSNIEVNKRKIVEYKDKRESYLAGTITQDGLTEHVDTFNPIKFGITSFFLLMLSIFIFLFYVAVVYKALIMPGSAIASQLRAGTWAINVLPHWSEAWLAMRSNPMVVFAPFVFFGFGYAVHTLLGLPQKSKYLWITLVLIITFVLDYLLALRIHDQLNNALNIVGLPPNDEFSDILIVLILGFVVYIIWSVIFHAWMLELDKRNIPARLGRMIRDFEKENVTYHKQIHTLKSDIEGRNSLVNQKKRILQVKTIPRSAIMNSITTYAQGWYRFISQYRDEKKRSKLMAECESVINEFSRNHQLNDLKINKNDVEND